MRRAFYNLVICLFLVAIGLLLTGLVPAVVKKVFGEWGGLYEIGFFIALLVSWTVVGIVFKRRE